MSGLFPPWHVLNENPKGRKEKTNQDVVSSTTHVLHIWPSALNIYSHPVDVNSNIKTRRRRLTHTKKIIWSRNQVEVQRPQPEPGSRSGTCSRADLKQEKYLHHISSIGRNCLGRALTQSDSQTSDVQKYACHHKFRVCVSVCLCVEEA